MKAALIALALLATPASAFTLDLSADNTTVVAGQSVILTFTVTVDSSQLFHPANATNNFQWWMSGNYTISSGDGQITPVGLITLGGGLTGIAQASQSATFTYANAGTFLPQLSGVLIGGIEDGAFYCGQCAAFNSLVGNWPAITVASVPEPATWALLLFGFAFFALKGIWPEGRA